MTVERDKKIQELEAQSREIMRHLRALDAEKHEERLQKNKTALNLENCPFCGSSRVKRFGGMTGGHDSWPYSEIVCLNCRGSSGHHNTDEAAILAWNRRR